MYCLYLDKTLSNKIIINSILQLTKTNMLSEFYKN